MTPYERSADHLAQEFRMPVARNPGVTSLVDILDRVLDQGIRVGGRPDAPWTAPPAGPGKLHVTVEAVNTHLEPPAPPPGMTGTGA
jgi:gas vesicle structural protein